MAREKYDPEKSAIAKASAAALRAWFSDADAEKQRFIDANLNKLPPAWSAMAKKQYEQKLVQFGDYVANTELIALVEPLDSRLDIAADDEQIKSLASDLANRSSLIFSQSLPREACRRVAVFCECYSVRFPDDLSPVEVQARVIVPAWWLPRLRSAHYKARELAAIRAGLVHKKMFAYSSDDTCHRRGEQLRRNAAILQDISMRSESGQVMSLKDIASRGMSNPDMRRAELITRLRGFEELGNKYGHKAEFITITCPSKFHAVRIGGDKNPKWDGVSSPADAQKYLVREWAKCRAQLARNGHKVYGLRVAEPHHDATPHWHLCLWYDGKIETLKSIRRSIAHYFCMPEHGELDEPIKKQGFRGVFDKCDRLLSDSNLDLIRVSFKSIDGRGAAGYVVKYVAKNIGGLDGEFDDETGKASIDSYKRVEAWASTWRIRQFQQIGGHGVTVWRELRRVDEVEAVRVGGHLLQAWRACQKVQDKKADFAAYIEAVGGLGVRPSESLIALDVDFISKRGRYGEALCAVLNGVRQRFGFGRARNNREQWVRV